MMCALVLGQEDWLPQYCLMMCALVLAPLPPPRFNNVYDVVRGALRYKSFPAIIGAFEYILGCAEACGHWN